MKVLIACEYSDVVGSAFRAEGHDVTSCDLLPSEASPNHVQGDVRPLLRKCWDIVIAFPPCNYLSNVNALYGKEREPWFASRQQDAIAFFQECLSANAPRVAVENPTMLGSAAAILGKPDDVVQPFEFGDWYRKRTCLWLRGLPPLIKTYIGPAQAWVRLRSKLKVDGHDSKRMATTDERNGHERSRFWPGIAEAMAKQWGNYSN